eukprot:3323075-Amphidinium_carterae.1
MDSCQQQQSDIPNAESAREAHRAEFRRMVEEARRMNHLNIAEMNNMMRCYAAGSKGATREPEKAMQ